MYPELYSSLLPLSTNLQSTFDIRLVLTYLREFITVLLAHNSGSQQDTEVLPE